MVPQTSRCVTHADSGVPWHLLRLCSPVLTLYHLFMLMLTSQKFLRVFFNRLWGSFALAELLFPCSLASGSCIHDRPLFQHWSHYIFTPGTLTGVIMYSSEHQMHVVGIIAWRFWVWFPKSSECLSRSTLPLCLNLECLGGSRAFLCSFPAPVCGCAFSVE